MKIPFCFHGCDANAGPCRWLVQQLDRRHHQPLLTASRRAGGVAGARA